MDEPMNEQKTALEKLPVLRDEALFGGSESFDPSLDVFNHEAYARAILKILIENKLPLSMGLFGPWGIGKSTIVSILFKLIAQERTKKLKPIYFNAWKYSGDSFRRQFLIEVAKQI
jgi:predicted KAP-like P-loop ATPase